MTSVFERVSMKMSPRDDMTLRVVAAISCAFAYETFWSTVRIGRFLSCAWMNWSRAFSSCVSLVVDAMRMMFPSSTYPSWLILRISSSAWSHGMSCRLTVTVPRTSGSRPMFSCVSSLNRWSVSLMSASLRFSELTQLNIVLDPDVRGTVTVSLQDIPWDQALELILKINQLGYVLEGNIMRIASTSKLTQEEISRQQFITAQDKNRPLRTVLQKVSYSNAAEMAATARKVMSARGDIFIDTRSNTLVIKELPDYLPTVLDLIKNLDIASPQVMIEARIVEATRTFSNQIGIAWGFNGAADAAHGNTTGLVFPNSGKVDGNVSLPSGAGQVL